MTSDDLMTTDDSMTAACDFLIVDDDASFRDVLVRALQRRGFNAISAADGAQALALAQTHAPRRAVVDLKLVNESGLDIIAALKQTHPDSEIVMLTGYSSIATAVEAVKRGALNYLCKPAGVDEILAAFDNDAGEESPAISALPHSIDRLEWEHIQKVLLDHDGNVSATARALGMHRRTLQRKLQKYPVKN
jgi:two-component system response regulator RegA